MVYLRLLDIAPDPVSMGVVLAVILVVCALIVLLLGALVFFLWYRKRSLRHIEMIRPDSPATAEPSQVNSPNQP
jgi:hypothetical protein